MAVNTDKGHRKGAVKQRSQVLNPATGLYVKRDTRTEKFISVKEDGTPFKGVRMENPTVTYHMNPSVKKSTAKRAEIAVRKTLGIKK